MEADALGEVGILGTVLLTVYSWTILPIFIEIGSHLTDKERKISWHSFFATRCINVQGINVPNLSFILRERGILMTPVEQKLNFSV